MTQEHWRPTGDIIRVDRGAVESMFDLLFQEWPQSPYVMREDGKWYMFYGEHGTGESSFSFPAGVFPGSKNQMMDC